MIAIISLTIVALLVLALGTGVWVGLALSIVGVVSLAIFKGMPVDKLYAQITWNASTTPELIALPLFILMGNLLTISGVSQ